MKTTSISTSWRKQRLIFYNLGQRKNPGSTKYGVFKAKNLGKKISIDLYLCLLPDNLGKVGVNNKQQNAQAKGKFV